jgi:hypothetical protein
MMNILSKRNEKQFCKKKKKNLPNRPFGSGIDFEMYKYLLFHLNDGQVRIYYYYLCCESHIDFFEQNVDRSLIRR